MKYFTSYVDNKKFYFTYVDYLICDTFNYAACLNKAVFITSFKRLASKRARAKNNLKRKGQSQLEEWNGRGAPHW